MQKGIKIKNNTFDQLENKNVSERVSERERERLLSISPNKFGISFRRVHIEHGPIKWASCL